MALKIIDKISATDEDIEHIRNEARILQALDHPNIIRATEFFEKKL